MMSFMREGGFMMWGMLVTAIAVAAVAFSRAREKRSGVLRAATILLLLEGVLGMCAGMKAVFFNLTTRPEFVSAPNQAALVAEGLAELANNGVLSAALVLIIWVAALVTGRSAVARA